MSVASTHTALSFAFPIPSPPLPSPPLPHPGTPRTFAEVQDFFQNGSISLRDTNIVGFAQKIQRCFGNIFSIVVDFWVFLEIWRLSFVLTICTSWLGLLHHPENTGLVLPVLPQEEVDLRQFALDFTEYKRVNSMFILLCLARLMHYFAHFDEAGVLVHCVVFAAKYLIVWFLVAILCFIYFAIMGMMMFGSSVAQVRRCSNCNN
jgi:hypothetical protein